MKTNLCEYFSRCKLPKLNMCMTKPEYCIHYKTNKQLESENDMKVKKGIGFKI